jgi:hypothetical protein
VKIVEEENKAIKDKTGRIGRRSRNGGESECLECLVEEGARRGNKVIITCFAVL